MMGITTPMAALAPVERPVEDEEGVLARTEAGMLWLVRSRMLVGLGSVRVVYVKTYLSITWMTPLTTR
jgi:hypothetical protein